MLRREWALEDAGGPIIGVVTRLVEQKGMDLVLDALPGLLAEGAQLVVLGSGDARLEEAFRAAAVTHRGQVDITTMQSLTNLEWSQDGLWAACLVCLCRQGAWV